MERKGPREGEKGIEGEREREGEKGICQLVMVIILVLFAVYV